MRNGLELADRVEIETERAFSNALKEKFSKEELHELAASFDSTPMKWEDWTRFQNLLHEALLDTFLGLGDREGLVQLLSVRCLKERTCTPISSSCSFSVVIS